VTDVEVDARVTQFATFRRRRRLDWQTFSSYWSDVHGPAVCELPGIRDYWQHHLLPDPGDSWPAIEGLRPLTTEAAQLDGAPELVFESDAARQKWLQVAAGIAGDEINLFDSMKHQLSGPGNALTLVGAAAEPLDDDEPLRSFRILVFVTARHEDAPLWDSLRESIAPAFAETGLLRRLRLSLLDPPEMSAWNPDGVTVATGETNFSACIELDWADYRSARAFYATEVFADAARELSRHAKYLNVYRCQASYAFVRDGVNLLPGRYGVARSRLIRAVGAINR
jgi:hypothetical protein